MAGAKLTIGIATVRIPAGETHAEPPSTFPSKVAHGGKGVLFLELLSAVARPGRVWLGKTTRG